MTPSGSFGLMLKGRHRRGLSPPSSSYMLGGGWLWTQIALQICSGESVCLERGTGGVFSRRWVRVSLLGVRVLHFYFFLLLLVRSNYCFFRAVEFPTIWPTGDE